MPTVCFQKGFKSDLLCLGWSLWCLQGCRSGRSEESGAMSLACHQEIEMVETVAHGGAGEGSAGGLQQACVQGTQEAPPNPSGGAPTPGEGALDVIPRAAGSQTQGETECPHLFPTPCLFPTIPFPRSWRLLSALYRGSYTDSRAGECTSQRSHITSSPGLSQSLLLAPETNVLSCGTCCQEQ